MHAREGEEEKGDRREGGYPAEVRWLLPWRRSCMVAREGRAWWPEMAVPLDGSKNGERERKKWCKN
jgi:hypothetical protein